ncbi:SPOR domain-containing protein [Methylogaea oryzae]|uniref:SPOR domain-containing protein n=1 Tax=Methylogaea oryzae TaxID=1295382 RepID=A0A8D5AJP7_9GAMM|nr:SPOR domain-containing protein [Methylogaea oryzae]BBL71024.1 hypothetical protein MoryE10_16300 [Methylogaea oryzae]
MDQQLKTRLIGVTIVVSLVVIFVPMLFEDSSDREAASIGAANVPEFPQELQSQALPLPSSAPKMAALPPAPEPTAIREEPLDPLDVPSGGGEPTDDMGVSADAQDALMPESAPRAGRSATAQNAPPKVKPLVKEAPSKPTAAELLKPLDKPKPAPVAEPAPAKAPVVPATPAAAPAAAKPKAAAPVAAKPPAAADAKPAPTAPVKMSAWIIQAGSFGDEANAKTLLVKLRQANVAAFVEMIPSPNGNSYRVRVGPELDRARAEATLKKMETEAGVKGMIVSYP